MGNLSIVNYEPLSARVQCGVRFMIDGYIAKAFVKPDYHELKMLMINILGEPGRHTIFEPIVQEFRTESPNNPGGISGFLMLAENHISFHTFPERSMVEIDAYTIQINIARDTVCSHLIDAFGLFDAEIHIPQRSQRHPVADFSANESDH